MSLMAAVRLRSWHLVPTDESAWRMRTLCGRRVVDSDPAAPTLPGNEKTCERCAVIAAKRGLTFASVPA